MAGNTRLAVLAQNAAADAIIAAIGASGFFNVYDGAQPLNPDTAIGVQVRIAHLPLSATAAPAAVAGLVTFNAITTDPATVAGTAAWCSLTTAAGVRKVDGSVGLSGANVNINVTTFADGGSLAISALTLQVLMQGA